MQRITRDRYLTDEEAARYELIRNAEQNFIYIADRDMALPTPYGFIDPHALFLTKLESLVLYVAANELLHA